jgi:energy-coupling factor transport system permease protein
VRFAPPVADVTAPLARRNPVAKLAAAAVLSLAPVSTLDPVTPALTLAAELALLPLFGLRYRELARRSWPLLVSALGIVVGLVLFAGDRTGDVLVPLGPVTVTTGVLAGALALGLRVFAIALPGVVVFATTDPTDLADSLIQQLKAPPRFAIGALAAFRLLPLLGDEWEMLTLARRARGVDPGRNPVARLRLFASTAFALLVGAIRRGTRLAVAMDARGFGELASRTSKPGGELASRTRKPGGELASRTSKPGGRGGGPRRTVARPQRFGLADTALILGAAALAAGILTLSPAILHLPLWR